MNGLTLSHFPFGNCATSVIARSAALGPRESLLRHIMARCWTMTSCTVVLVMG
jgi:hypothetical protein